MKLLKVLPLLALLLLSACGEFSLGIEPAPTAPPAAVPASPAATAPPAAPPSPTPPAPDPTAEPTQGTMKVKIFLIAVDDQGKSGAAVGCGDSAVPVEVEVPSTQGVLRAALEALLSIKQQYYGQSGLYNALYQSDLRIDSLTLTDGKAAVSLTGKMSLGGECDNPRFEAQITQTILQFPGVTVADVTINGRPLQDALSLK